MISYASVVVLGKIVIANLQNILGLVDKVSRAVTGSATVLTQIPFNASIGNGEIAVVCVFVFILSLLFTSIGCRRIYKSEIMEVILHASYDQSFFDNLEDLLIEGDFGARNAMMISDEVNERKPTVRM